MAKKLLLNYYTSFNRYFWILFLFFQPYNFVEAQQYNFISYSLENGLSQSEISAIFQDSRGYLWVGTYGGGVCKFDGKEFTSYEEQSGLSGQLVSTIAESKDGNLWFGTTWGGVCRFDGKTIKTFDFTTGITDNLVHSILVAKNGEIYFGTANGLNVYKDDNVVAFDKSIKVKSNDVFFFKSLVQDKNGTIWAGTNKGLFYINKNKKIVGNKSFKEPIQQIILDSVSNIIILAESGKIYKGIISAQSEVAVTEIIGPLPLLQEDDKPSKIYLDNYDRLWIATAESGVYMKQGSNEIVRYSKEQGLPTNSILSIFQDKTGCIWLGSKGQGLIKFKDKSFTYFDALPGLKSDDIFQILNDIEGNIWISSLSGGVYKYDGKSSIRMDEKLPISKTRSMCQLKSGKILMGGTKGLRLYDKGELKVFNFPGEDVIPKISTIFEDSRNQIWIGTFGQGLYMYDNITLHHFEDAEGFSQKYVYSILEYVNGDIWIGTGGGVFAYNKSFFKHYTDVDGLCNSFVGSMVQDKCGNIYMGTDKCVARFDGKKITSYNNSNGLTSSTVYLLHCDKNNNLYVGTNKGFDMITFDKQGGINKIKKYGFYEGFKGVECNSRAVAEDGHGNIWFGTIKGLIKFSADEENKLNLNTEKVFITAVKVNFVPIAYDSINVYNKWFHLPNSPQITYANERITFEFATINPANSRKFNYSFMLENYEKKWSPWGIDNIASYSNLSPGKYSFKVKALSSDGQESSETNYSFVIKSPYYSTWWFLLLISSLLIYVTYSIIKLRKRKEDSNREKLERIIAQRTFEIQKKNEEKEIMLKEIHHRVKNNLQVIISLINIQSSYVEDKKALSIFEECQNRIRTISLIHEKLYKSNDFRNINFNDYLIMLTQDLVQTYNINKQIKLNTDLQIEFFNLNTIVPLGLMLNEIISNSLKYAFANLDEGEINISVIQMPNNRFQMIIGDNGAGYEGEPNKPSKSTLGLELIKILSEQLDGNIIKMDMPGTVYCLEFSLQKN